LDELRNLQRPQLGSLDLRAAFSGEIELLSSKTRTGIQDGKYTAIQRAYARLRDSTWQFFWTHVVGNGPQKEARAALATLASLSPRDETSESFAAGRPRKRISRRLREHRLTLAF
jgi:hypothetical protein